jgi:hypothetical protein
MNRMGLALSAVLAVVLLALAPVPAAAVVPSLPGTASGAAAIVKYMPKDSTLAIAINVSKLAEAGVFDMIEQMAGEDAFAELKELGIDVKNDITDVMISLVFDPDQPDEPQAYIAIAGKLPDKDKILAAYKEEMGEDAESKQVEGKTVYDMDEVDVCFLPDAILLAPTEDGGADIAKMLGGPTNSLVANVGLAALMNDVNTKATVWVIGSFSDELREAMGQDDEDAPIDMSALKTLTASFDYAATVALDIAMGFADEETPTALVEMFNTQVKPMAEMMPPAAPLINALDVKAAGSKATIKMSMSQEDFKTALEGLASMMFGAMMGGMEVEEEGEEDVEW